MSIIELKNSPDLTDYQEVNIGKLYFFENFVTAEFDEGVHINFENFSESSELISTYFGDRAFGFIANRTNTYSLDLNDAKRFNESFPTLKGYAVVSDTLFGKGVFEIENQFFTYNRKIFRALPDAIDWVNKTLSVK